MKNDEGHDYFVLLFLEADPSGEHFSFAERSLDSLVQHMQPSPAITHVEMFIPSSDISGDDLHFSTYLGAEGAAWSNGYGDGQDFYLNPLGNGASWRAVPVFARSAVHRVRTECHDHLDTPYPSISRLFNYPFSVPPMRAFAHHLDDRRGTAAHCAALTARILASSMPELNVPNAAPWYGPSTLYLELARQGRMVSYAAKSQVNATVKSTVDYENATSALEILLRGSDQAVRDLSEESVRSGTNLACDLCVAAGVDADPTTVRAREKDLARASLRDSWIGRPARMARLAALAAVAAVAAAAPAPVAPVAPVAPAPTPTSAVAAAATLISAPDDVPDHTPSHAHTHTPLSCNSNTSTSDQKWVPVVDALYKP